MRNAELRTTRKQRAQCRCSFRAPHSALRTCLAAAALAGVLAVAPGCDRLFPSQKDPKATEKKAPPPVPVLAAPVVQKTVPLELRTFGAAEPNLMATVKAQVTGVLTKIYFKEGQDVKQGDLLFTIDKRPYEAALQQTQANYTRDRAQYTNALKEAERQAELLKTHVAAQQDYDAAKTAADALYATLLADQAMIETAKIQIEYCTIRSPIDARAGAWQVDEGNLVKANDQLLVTLNQVRPIQLGFSLPQRELARVKTQAATGKLQVNAIIPGQEGRPEAGTLTFIDNTVDRTTGTFLLKATFPNPKERLWPGQFVNVVLVLQEEPDRIIVPTRAIQTGQKGQFVYVIGPDKKVRDQLVTPGRTINDDTIITEGLKAGETVVTDGQLKLVPGAEVVVKESLAAAAQPKAKADADRPPKSDDKGGQGPGKGGKGGGATASGPKTAPGEKSQADPGEAAKQ